MSLGTNRPAEENGATVKHWGNLNGKLEAINPKAAGKIPFGGILLLVKQVQRFYCHLQRQTDSM
jgi:hypothetical protein